MNKVALKEPGDIFSVVNELDKISTILLPPEDTPENLAQHKSKQNPYFKQPDYDINSKYGSMLNNYQQTAGLDSHRKVIERDMLSSQYSSVASTIANDKHMVMMSPADSNHGKGTNRNFIIRNVSNKKRGGKNGKRVFPKDFFTN